MNLDKRVLTMMVAILMAMFTPKAWAQDVWDGKTMEEVIPEGDIYKIKTGAQLAWVADQGSDLFKDKTIKLENDIDLGNKQWTPIGYFKGTFNGQGNTIKGLYIDIDLPESDSQYPNDITIGLFNSISGGTVTQLGVSGEINVKVVNQRVFAGAISSVNGGTITQCYTNVAITITSDKSCLIGGIVGDTSGTVSDCYTTGNITVKKGDLNIGGISGIVRSGSISGCYATGAVTAETNEGRIGGITGSDYNDNSLKNCIALNSQITSSGSRVVDYGTPVDCYASKTLSGWADTPQNGLTLTMDIDLKDVFTTEGAWTFTDDSFPTLTAFGTSQPTPPLIADNAEKGSSVSNELQSSTHVWTIPGNLCIRSDSPVDIRIYTFYGHQIKTISAHSGEITLPLPSNNYLVVVDGSSHKVQIRQ